MCRHSTRFHYLASDPNQPGHGCTACDSDADDAVDPGAHHQKIAEHFCDRGDHRQAAHHFIIAAFHHEMAGDWYLQAYCEGQWDAEMRQLRPSAPVNVSALVD